MNNTQRQATKHTDRRHEPESRIRCGKISEHSQHYPAKQATYHKCQKRGHLQKLYKIRKAETVSKKENNEHAFVGSVESSGKSWKISLFVNDIPIQFKIDIGVEVSVIYSSLLLETLRAQVNNSFKYVASVHVQCGWTKSLQDKKFMSSKV